MGTWGVLAFDNDNACDWAGDLDDASDLSLVASTLLCAEQESEIDAPTAEEALAACEVLARLLGHPGYSNAYTEGVDDWVAAHPIKPPEELLARARSVIDRVLADGSELRSLWEESEHLNEWQRAIHELRSRLEF